MNDEAPEKSLDEKTKANTKLLAYWTVAWLLTMALAVFGPLLLWESKIITSLAILVNTLIGAGVIWANKVYLEGLDELWRKIYMDAMAITLGVGLIGGLSYSTMDTTNLISVDAEISHLVMLMGITYLIAVIVGQAKYK